MDHDISVLKKQLLQLTELRDAGALTPDQFEQSKIQIERKILDCVMSGDVAVVTQPGSIGATPTPTAIPTASAQEQAPAALKQRPPMRLMAGLAALIVVVATAGYILTRTAEPVTGAGEEAAAPDATGTAQPHATNSEQMGAMMDKLAARLKDNPGDAGGWAMLARSYGVLGRSAEAVDAYAKALALSKNDAGLMVDYADALAVKNNRSLAGEPMKLITRALKLDPRNVKALAMAGTDAFDRKDYRTAVKHWEQVVEFGGPDNLFVQQIQSGLAEARQLAGLPPAPAAASSGLVAVPPATVPASTAAVAATGGTIQGTVTLAAALIREAKPEDTVFIFARAAEGPRMPLAILRRQVKDLPINFTLDDSMAMSPAANLSKAGRVTVGARISKSGNAIPEKGDLAGQSAPVTVGAKGLTIEIKDIVKQ